MVKVFNNQKIKKEEIGLTRCGNPHNENYTDARNDVAKYNEWHWIFKTYC